MRFILLTLSAVVLSFSFYAQAVMYKWVDEEGQMHFGDKIPQKYQVKAHDELNEKGMTTQHREAAKTPAERAEEIRLEEERRVTALEEKKERQLDRELLDTYTTERDLIIARDSRLDAVAIQMELSEIIISSSNKKIEAMEKQAAEIKASNREVPIELNNRIDNEKQQVTVQTRIMKKHKKRSDNISKKFHGYIERYRVARPN